MPDQNPADDCDAPKDDAPLPEEGFLAIVPVGMTLENIVDRTGELEHLNGGGYAKVSKIRRIFLHGIVFFPGAADPGPARSGESNFAIITG